MLKCILVKKKQSQVKAAYFILLRLCFSLLTSCLELYFANVFVATNDNRRKLGCMAVTVLFHYVMHFH